MLDISVFGDSFLKGVIYENNTYKVSQNRFSEIYSYLIDEFKKIGKEPVLLSLPPIDSTKYFDYISKKLNTDNILKLMEGNKQFLTNWHERYI